jgi:uncharacterized phiE125 gp8 family phage protein
MQQHDIHSTFTRVVAPTELPVTVAQAADELDIVDDPSRNDQLERLIRWATELVETDTRRLLLPQTWQLRLDRFPSAAIQLRRVPVTAVDYVNYLLDETWYTMDSADYVVDLRSEPARIRPARNMTWPTTDDVMHAVVVQFQGGYASVDEVPSLAKEAILYAVRQRFYGCAELGENYWHLIGRLQWGGYE